MRLSDYCSDAEWAKIKKLADEKETPFLVVDLEIIKQKYEELTGCFPMAKVHYALKANFSDLGLLPGGYFPGAKGLSGMVEFSEKGGSLALDAGRSGISLPAVFPEPDIAFDLTTPSIDRRPVRVIQQDGSAVDYARDRRDVAQCHA